MRREQHYAENGPCVLFRSLHKLPAHSETLPTLQALLTQVMCIRLPQYGNLVQAQLNTMLHP